MDYRTIFEIGAAGMALEKRRLDVAALNLASMHSTAPASAESYRPLRVVAQAGPGGFAQAMARQAGETPVPYMAVQTIPVPVKDRLQHDPAHPHADAQGFVHYPGVDHAQEMITAMTALRAYEANVAAMALARAMGARALEIGGAGR